ncbi:MAG: hypothetical protein MJ229_01040 [bacterium]|nr:hypothetical protein [bacterium]
MEINSSLYQNSSATSINKKNTNFGATKLYNVNLKKMINGNMDKFIPAEIIKLDPNDAADKSQISKLFGPWSRTEYGEDSFANFMHNIEGNYFVTAIKDKAQELSKKITCFIQTTDAKNAPNKTNYEIVYLQAAPDLKKASEAIKGSGELSMYNAVKEAKENGFKKVHVLSTNNPFYEHLGFDKKLEIPIEDKEGGVFELPAQKFDEFLNKIAKKYNLK